MLAPDENAFQDLATHVSDLISPDYVLVCELDDPSAPQVARTLIVHSRGKNLDNFEYDLRGTPCANVVKSNVCVYAYNVADLFPEDALLVEMGITGYGVISLKNSVGLTVGILAVLYKKPLDDPASIRTSLEAFSGWATADMNRYQVQRAIERSDVFYRALFQQSPNAILLIDPETTKPVHFNDRLLEILGYTRMEFAQLSLSDFEAGIEPEEIKAFVRRVLEAGGAEFQTKFRTKEGSLGDAIVNIRVLDLSGKKFLHSVMQDVTERIKVESEVQHARTRFESLYHLSQMVDDSDQVIKDFALQAGIDLTRSAYGYLLFLNDDETGFIMHAASKGVMPECGITDKPSSFEVSGTGLWGEAVRQRKPIITNDYEAANPLKKGYPEGHVPIKRHMNIPLLDNGRIVLVAGVANKEDEYDQSDVMQLVLIMTDMWRLLQKKETEKQLSHSLKEKEILLKEIHHRVKNNMMTISGLLTLQAQSEKDGKIVRLVSQSKARIQTMAMIHEMLYMSESLGEFEFGAYLQKLVEKIKTALVFDPKKIGIRIEAEKIILSPDQAIPCALSITEILSNSIEHAFPGDRSGEILIELKLSEDDEVQVTISDNGVGIPEGKGARKGTLGLSLVESLVTNQLFGRFERDEVAEGSRFSIRFKRDSKGSGREFVSR
jgi:PAS domain S-box-containing protein